jgi:hypothetical protein
MSDFPAEKQTTWLKRSSDQTVTGTTRLTLRSDGTYTKELAVESNPECSPGKANPLVNALGGTHHGTWTRQGDLIHLSGDGNWPACTETLSLFQRVENPRPQLTPPSETPFSFSEEVARAHRMMDLDRRALLALMCIDPGRASDALAGEFIQIQQGYQGLLQAGPSALYSLDSLRAKIAEAEDSIARVHDSLNHVDLAISHYEAASVMFEALGDIGKVERARANIGRLRLAIGGEIDSEFTRVSSLLEATPENTLAHASLLVELGELQAKSSDDYEAQRTLNAALVELSFCGSDPPESEILAATNATLLAVQQGTVQPGASSIEQVLSRRYLYRRVYLALAQIFKETEPAKSAHYLELSRYREGETQATGLSDHVVQALYGAFRKFEP